jgi:hypothetical protein
MGLLIPAFSFLCKSGFSTIVVIKTAMLFLEITVPVSGSPSCVIA